MMWLTQFLKVRVICDDDGVPYLERYYFATIFGKRIFIHRFMSSDPDRGLHDHPWSWAFSLILAGGYNEIIKCNDDYVGIVYRSAPALNKLNGERFHRILMEPENFGKTWSMFVHGPRVKDWGFMEYTAWDDRIVESNYKKASSPAERKQNQHWWKKAETLTGKKLRSGYQYER